MPPQTTKAKPLANGTKTKPLATNHRRLRCLLRVVGSAVILAQGGGKRRAVIAVCDAIPS